MIAITFPYGRPAARRAAPDDPAEGEEGGEPTSRPHTSRLQVAATCLNGRLVAHAGTGEQFVLWALRQRRADGDAETAALARGFFLALGLSQVERGLNAFESWYRALAADRGRAWTIAPLVCPVISDDEADLLDMIALIQQATHRSENAEAVAAPVRFEAWNLAILLKSAAFRVPRRRTRRDIRLPDRTPASLASVRRD